MNLANNARRSYHLLVVTFLVNGGSDSMTINFASELKELHRGHSGTIGTAGGLSSAILYCRICLGFHVPEPPSEKFT